MKVQQMVKKRKTVVANSGMGMGKTQIRGTIDEVKQPIVIAVFMIVPSLSGGD